MLAPYVSFPPLPDACVHRVFEDTRARVQSTRCRAGSERARVNVPRGGLVSFSILISPRPVLVPRSIVLPHSLIQDFFSPLLLLCIIPVTCRGGILHA